MASTLLKYAGNKRKIMSKINPYLGDWKGIKRYVEPFAGALGSALNADIPEDVDIALSDANRDIVELYQEIARDPMQVQNVANSFPTDEAGYYAIREWDRDPSWPSNKTKLERAARTLYLNKRGFNGLYRSNRHGFFTTPWGRNPHPRPIDVISHVQFIEFIQKRVTVQLSDWKDVVRTCGKGDVIYADPPYVDLKDPKKDFCGYIGAFGWGEQVTLHDELKSAANRGARVVASNSWCDATLDLYDGWNKICISADRHISAKAESRGKISELLAWLPGQ